MADLIKKIKIKKQDGTFTDYIPIGAEASNVSTEDGLSVENKLNKNMLWKLQGWNIPCFFYAQKSKIYIFIKIASNDVCEKTQKVVNQKEK